MIHFASVHVAEQRCRIRGFSIALKFSMVSGFSSHLFLYILARWGIASALLVPVPAQECTGRSQLTELRVAVPSRYDIDSFGGLESNSKIELQRRVNELRNQQHKCLREARFEGAMHAIQKMMDILRERYGTEEEVMFLGQSIDKSVEAFAYQAFAPPFTCADKGRVCLCIEALQMQASCRQLPPPYNRIPKRTYLAAMRAISSLVVMRHDYDIESISDELADTAFRLLQRLISGVGVRMDEPSSLGERDFNILLNAFSKTGRMDLAHKTMALQVRNNRRSLTSPVSYSILLKGYGRIGDLKHVDLIAEAADRNRVLVDSIFCNSLIDAYINCGALARAKEKFEKMKSSAYQTNPGGNGVKYPLPNKRTYNTILKGLANDGAMDEALLLAAEMRKKGLWDCITTNTLVHAALISKNTSMAENILLHNTVTSFDAKCQHPNLEAYSELVDSYCKEGVLERAVQIFQTMRLKSVEPNEVTYTSLISGLVRNNRTDQAWKMIKYMQSAGPKPTSITYNAFITGLLCNAKNETAKYCEVASLDERVDEAMKVLTYMVENSGLRPRVATIAVLVEAFGRCKEARVNEAMALVAKLEVERIVPQGDLKIVTALLQTCAMGGDIRSAIHFFRTLRRPDTIAINAFLDACCRCKRESLAFEIFDHFFVKTTEGQSPPDVVSYSIVISAHLKRNTIKDISRAQDLYHKMKNKDNIFPDIALIDMILRCMVRLGQSNDLTTGNAAFLKTILRDAENLTWEEGQLEKRKRAVRAVIADKLERGSWVWHNSKEIDTSQLVSPSNNPVDKLFAKKGWNQVDSGFRLWGSPAASTPQKRPSPKTNDVDAFLRAHGWNDVDSSFRII